MRALTIPSGLLWLAADLFLPDPAVWPGARPAVIVLHGFAGNRESHAEFGEYLSERGFVALTLDQRGHGGSGGRMDAGILDDVGAALAYLRGQAGVDHGRITVRGSSMGGNIAIRSAARFPEAAAVIAVCPATESMLIPWVESGRAEAESGDLGLSVRLDRAGLLSYLRADDVRQAVARISPRPLLLIQAKGDAVVPWQSTQELYGLASEPRELILLEGGDHRSAQHDPAVHAQEVNWLRRALGTI